MADQLGQGVAGGGRRRVRVVAAASLTWALWERIKFGRASLVGLVTGTIAGLASITPASVGSRGESGRWSRAMAQLRTNAAGIPSFPVPPVNLPPERCPAVTPVPEATSVI